MSTLTAAALIPAISFGGLGPTGIIAAVSLISILVFVHEFGHFLFAKLFGVQVLVFSIGFGRRLFGVHWKGTDYRVCMLPIGGFVQMEGADPFMDGGEPGAWESPGNFLKKPVWQRLIIVSAGPVFNLLLPVVVFTALYMSGEPQAISEIGTVAADGPARQEGLAPGDRIVEVEGTPVSFWSQLYDLLGAAAADGTVGLVVDRDGAHRAVTLAVPQDTQVREDGILSPLAFGMDNGFPEALIGVDDPDSPAAAAGLESFDRVLSVNGEPVANYQEVLWALQEAGETASLRYGRVVDGESVQREVQLRADADWTPPELPFNDLLANRWGLSPSYIYVGEILDDSPAQAANILRGDRIAGINGEPVVAWREIIERIADTWADGGDQASPVELTLVRAGRVLQVKLTPDIIRDTDVFGRYRKRARIGIGSGGTLVDGPQAKRFYTLAAALPKATSETVALSGFVVEQVGKLLTGEAAPSKTLGGPLQIFRDAKAAAEEGIYKWVRMMGILSISLGIINFLPVPVLDGGQFLFYLIEGIRGRPVPLIVRERAQQIGVLFLVGLMLTVFVFDINRALS